MNSDQQPLFPPSVLFKSFLLVAGAYMLDVLLIGVSGLILLATLFPDSFAILNSEPEAYNQVFENEPERIFPPALMWSLLGISVILSFALGYLVARLAPIGKFSHGILLAAILFVQYLQLAISATDSLQRMIILFMAVSPIAVLLGANVYLSNISRPISEGR